MNIKEFIKLRIIVDFKLSQPGLASLKLLDLNSNYEQYITGC
jgi:hypothetical protein